MRNSIWKVPLTLQLMLFLVLGLASCGGGQYGGSSGGGGNGGGGGGANPPTAGEYLWELSLTDGNLYIATVNQNTGQLGTPATSGGLACNSLGPIPSLAVAPSRKFTFVIDKCITSIHVYSVSGPGVVLQEIPQSPYYVSSALDSIAINPSGSFLYAIGSPGVIYQMSVNASTGELTLNTPTTVNGDVRELIVDPQGKFAFVNDLTDGRVLAYSIGSDGSLSPVPGSPFAVPAGGLPVNLVITNDGSFLYAPLIPSGIAAFAVNRSTGTLSNVAGSPFATSNQPFSLAIGAGGKFIYSIGGSSNNAIQGFSIDGSTGALAAVAGSPFVMPSSFSSLTVDASGRFLYATSQTAILSQSMIFGLAIDSSAGTLTTLTGAPYQAPPFPVDTVSLNIP